MWRRSDGASDGLPRDRHGGQHGNGPLDSRLLGQGSEKAEHQPVFRFGFEQERLRRLAERGASGVAREFHGIAHHSRVAAIRAIGGPTVGKRTV